MITKIFNARVLRNGQLINEDFWFQDSTIIAPASKADKEIDAKGLILAPGYIDIQINGGFGYDFSTDVNCLAPVCKQLPKFGVTAFLATVITSEKEQYSRLLPHLTTIKGGALGAHCMGLHLEGPFLNPKQKGAHREDFMEIPKDWTFEQFYGSLEHVKIITLAPELPGALRTIKQLNERGIVVSLGHSEASLVVMREAVEAGARLVTHLFNAVMPFHHRIPGVIGAALTLPELYCSLICDGIHLYPAAIDITWRCKKDKVIIVTDAIAALGLSEGVYRLGEEIVEVDEKKAYIPATKQLAGAISPMDASVRYFMQSTGCTCVEAIEAASTRAAELMQWPTKGNLSIGSDADFNLLDNDLYVKQTWVAGIQQLHLR